METYQRYRRRINYYETDQMGIVHHSNYIRFFEEARLDWMEQKEMDYHRIEELGMIIPVTFVHSNYLIPLHYNDTVEIQVALTKFDGIKMEFSYKLYREGSEELCTTGQTGHCFLYRDMRPVRMKRAFPELYRSMKESVEEG